MRRRDVLTLLGGAAVSWPLAEAIGRVVSRYAIDLSSGVEVTVPQDGINVTYMARAAINLASVVRAARTASAA